MSPEEDALVRSLHAQLGNRWTEMALALPGNDVKNPWHSSVLRHKWQGGRDADGTRSVAETKGAPSAELQPGWASLPLLQNDILLHENLFIQQFVCLFSAKLE